jgi:hypothetical protein
MPGRLVVVLEFVVIVVLVLLYAAFRKYIRPRFAPDKNTGDIPQRTQYLEPGARVRPVVVPLRAWSRPALKAVGTSYERPPTGVAVLSPLKLL